MISSVLKGNRAQVKVSLLFLISLCLVIISFVFAADLDSSLKGASSPDGIYLSHQDDVWLPVTFTCDASLHKINHTEYTAYKRAVSARSAGVFFKAPLCLTVNPHGISICLGSFGGVLRENLGQVCRLLDIPPPSNTFSI